MIAVEAAGNRRGGRRSCGLKRQTLLVGSNLGHCWEKKLKVAIDSLGKSWTGNGVEDFPL